MLSRRRLPLPLPVRLCSGLRLDGGQEEELQPAGTACEPAPSESAHGYRVRRPPPRLHLLTSASACCSQPSLRTSATAFESNRISHGHLRNRLRQAQPRRLLPSSAARLSL
ncbi:hypothetical protein PR202_gb29274 [Eleusine coracana subsp. coracana]|uniref:Uncharacterized protein n=1 Tax=Eleusine coracana subsp. coracana TaxID=191504 RepID=A0AAV5G043_ELECO|nr:hypothetical protein PR202_gb29274 [Eleusine coracana subsp. coracana]